MEGLFEDDANVRKQPKIKKAAQVKSKKPAQKSISAKILERVELKADLVGSAAGSQSIDFAKVDVSPLRKKKAIKKDDDGKLSPPINYVRDIT